MGHTFGATHSREQCLNPARQAREVFLPPLQMRKLRLAEVQWLISSAILTTK